MSSLVPEKRLDKNQRLVTRYVKPAGSTSGTVLPGMPTMASLTAADPALDRLADMIDDKRNEITLASLPQESIDGLRSITEHLSKEPDGAVIWKLMNPKQSRGEGTELGNDIKGLAKYHRLQEGVPLNETLSAVRGAWAYDYGKEQKTDEQVIRALIDTVPVVLRVLEGVAGGYDYPDEDDDGEFLQNLDNYYSFFGGDMGDKGDESLWVRNEDFVNLIKDHADKAEAIFAIISDRQTTNPQTIRALIETDIHPSMVEGAL